MNALVEVPDVAGKKQGDFSLEGIDFISDGDQYLTFCLENEHYGVISFRLLRFVVGKCRL